ncbi:ShlB/FhaC/HecB family hemolysin secretion/activation protein [Luteolibacter marinus]|uniref:ShlB/FhaC/HecB family hemolysin secretion/activation protein n=1 Tax=Luteolibacter marinus TaxID=2776705 RepID=UPI0018680F5A|nr:ShlB/FhaC/HecB family hemolysin secretion/activation protein [Luteolibacter marinus]
MPRDPEGEAAAVVRLGEATGVHGWVADDSPVLIDRLDQLVVSGSETDAPPVTAGGVQLTGLSVAATGDLAGELAGWIGKPLTEAGLDRLLEVILRHYDDHDRPMNDVWVPPQSGEAGQLVVEVVEGRIGAVGIEEMSRFNNRLVRRGLHLTEGDLLTSSGLQADLDWLSRNPFRKAELFAAPGDGVSADLLLRIDEQRPWRAYAGYDNTGAEAVGENRWFTGFNLGNAFGLDQVLGYQFTMGDSLDRFHAHSLSWEIPLHRLHHFIRLSGAWADVSAVDHQSGLPVNSDGTSWLAGIAYGRPLPRLGEWRQEIRGGLEFKRADNFVIFGQTRFPQTEVDVVQLRGEWQGSGPLWGGRAELQADLVASPGNLTGKNGRQEFDAFRPGADPTYAYGRLEGTWLAPMPGNWSWRLHSTAQLASGALLPTEQLGLGGYDSVRGYGERIQLADSGYAVSAELRTPAAGLFRKDWLLQGLVFIDHGHGWSEGDGDESLTGIGLGSRLALGSTGTARLDIGWGLKDGSGAQVHAGMMFSF